MPRFLRYRSAKVGFVMLIVVATIALVGPLVAPHTQSEFVGVPFSRPGAAGAGILGTDFLAEMS